MGEWEPIFFLWAGIAAALSPWFVLAIGMWRLTK
jgi:hypothetical protein